MGGELLITIVGTVGETAIVPERLKGWNVARAIAVIPVQADVGAYWVKMALRSDEAKARIESRLNTTVQATLNLSDLATLRILLPPKHERSRIAQTLKAFDDKIDLNRRMNETLEAVARAIFKDWFVDFGPTRAKMEGRAPYLAPELWDLFPKSLDDEGVPLSWTRQQLIELCQLKRGYDLPTGLRKEGIYPIVSSSGVSGYHAQAMATAPGIVTGRYGTIGQVFFVETDFWPLNTALYVKNFKGGSPRFIFYTLCGLDFQQFSDKGAVPGVNRNDLHQWPVVIPPAHVQTAFEAVLSSVWKRIALNEHEASTLAQTRDLLLPKLMSGELRVRDAERAIEEIL